MFRCTTLLAQPVANFTANKTSGCSPLTVQFTSTSTGSPTSYLWNFGNSNTSTIQTPSATYVLPGTYTVSLKVTNASGSNTKTVTAFITVYSNPVADFTASPLSGCVPLSVAFTNTSTPGNGAINSWTWDYGNGNTGSIANPSTTYSLPASYSITLNIRDVNGCESTITKPNYITASSAFTANFSATGTVSCVSPATVNFTSTTSISDNYTYLWKFGDNTTSTQANPSKTYNASGIYTVILEVTAPNGCKQTVTKTSFVKIGGVNANFTYTTSNDCAPTNLFLTNTTTPTPAGHSYQWRLNGGTLNLNQNTSYNLVNKVNTVSLRVIDSAGCVDSISKTITLQDLPTADFSPDKDYFCSPPATVNFTNLSSGGATTYAWNFGNSLGNSAVNPTTTYNSSGQFQVRLISTKPTGCRDTIFKTITVDGPSVTITDLNSKKGCAPLNAQFRVTDNRYRPFTTWKWELNGNVLSNTKDFNYTFNSVGVYVLKLTGTNASGCIYENYDTVRVSDPPLFDISADKYTVCYNPGIVTFRYIALNSVVPDNIRWTVTNSLSTVSGTGDTLMIRFNDTGYFSVKVNASKDGCPTIVEKTNWIRINPAVANFASTIDTCATDTAYFKNLSKGKNRLFWNFDDGGATSTQPNTTFHVYTNAGTYRVKLVATDTVTGCVDSIIQPVIIIQPPKVKFTPLDTALCMGGSVTFKDLSSLDPSRTIKKWTYKLSDNRTSGVQNPVYSFPSSGTYHMTLTIEDNLKCQYKYVDTNTVKVYAGRAGFTLSPNMGCVPLFVNTNDTSVLENPAVSRTWLWGDGDSLTSINNFGGHSYNTASSNQKNGTNITLTVTDNKGCKFVAVKNVKPYKPVANYTFNTIKSCGLDSTVLKATVTAQSVNTPATYKWLLPQGISMSSSTSFNAYNDTTYQVQLVLRDSFGCVDSITKSISVNARKPIIGFDGFPKNIPCITKFDSAIKFLDTSIAGGSPIIKREWRFGNGNIAQKTGDTVTAAAIYKIPGKYTVFLKITDSIGCVDSLTIPEFIFAGGPTGTYSFTPTRGCTPIHVDFKVNSPNSAKFTWDHAEGDVTTYTKDTHSYEYTEPRTYYPRLTLIDSSLTCEYGLDAIDSLVVLPLPQPDFASDQTIICKGGVVRFSNLTSPHPSPINNWKWTFGTGDSSLLRTPLAQVFSIPGQFSITLEATDTNGCYGKIVKDTFITVNDDTIPPAIPIVKRATVEDNESVLFEYVPNTEVDFAKYVIYSNTNQFTIPDINDTSLLETGLNTLNAAYSYKMYAMDVCQNASTFSEQHTTVELKATGSVNSIDINWSAYQGFDTSFYYELWRKNAEESAFSLLTTLPKDTLHYTDTSILCHQTYYYRIKSVETDSSEQISWSDTAGATPVYVAILPLPENIRATVVNNKNVLLEWHLAKHNRVFNYHIYRAEDNGVPVLYRILNASDTFLLDVDVNVQEHSYQYTTYVVDACGGMSSPSNIANTILLNVRMIGNDILKHDPTLTWNPYYQWETGVDHYNVEFKDEATQSFELICRNNNDQFVAKHKYINLIQSEYCYLVTAFKTGDTSIFSESNIACVSTAPRLYAPNVFTINNDNLNDVFYVRGVFIAQFNLKIYNRWGELMFESNNINEGWDGTLNGEKCKPDVYVYMAEGIGIKGQRINIKGNVTLMR